MLKEELMEQNEIVIREFGRFSTVRTKSKPSPFLNGEMTKSRLKIVFKPAMTLTKKLDKIEDH